MKIENLDELIETMKEYFPHYTCSRGRETAIISDSPKHAPDYEVVRVFGKNVPFVEFWKGYYEWDPEGLTGIIINARFRSASVLSSCENIIRDMLNRR